MPSISTAIHGVKETSSKLSYQFLLHFAELFTLIVSFAAGTNTKRQQPRVLTVHKLATIITQCVISAISASPAATVSSLVKEFVDDMCTCTEQRISRNTPTQWQL